MKILFDQGTPAPLRRVLTAHEVSTTFESGWSTLTNGALLDAAESTFDLFITTDKNLRQQQIIAGRKLAIVVLPTTSWPVIREHVTEVRRAVEGVRPGEYLELTWE